MSATDFDFLFGPSWQVHHRRRAEDGTWQEFAGTCAVAPVLGGLGHVDTLDVPDWPGGGSLTSLTVRLHEPEPDLWRIWWAASSRPGHLDPPMVGRFTGGLGTFEGEDALRPAGGRLRFVWTPVRADGPRWEQLRSADGGATWASDWTMDFTRRPAEAP